MTATCKHIMYYLYDTDAKQIPKTFEDFHENIKKSSSYRAIKQMPNLECSVCTTEKVDVFALQRSCACETYKCEKHICKCVQSTATGEKCYYTCSKCIVMCLWQVYIPFTNE